MKWLLLVLMLMPSVAAAQPSLPARERQDRRASLPTSPAESLLEVYVAAGNITTVAFNGPLDHDSLVVDRTRFKWVDVGNHILTIEPISDLGPGERLIMQVGFKDRALPAKAVLAIISKADVMDGKVEVDRRANTPEALLAALAQKEAELEELKTRDARNGPASVVLSGWLNKRMALVTLRSKVAPGDASHLDVGESTGYASASSTLVAVRLRNLPGQMPWALGQARLTGPGGTPVKVLSVHMKHPSLAPGEEALVVVETETPPWSTGRFKVELVDASSTRRLSFDVWQ